MVTMVSAKAMASDWLKWLLGNVKWLLGDAGQPHSGVSEISLVQIREVLTNPNPEHKKVKMTPQNFSCFPFLFLI